MSPFSLVMLKPSGDTQLAAAKEGYVLEGQEGPMLSGKVLTVRDNLVMLSLGKDDKVKTGMKFIVSRNGRYLGDVQVLKVYDDFAGAEVLFLADQKELIKEGDDAKTKRL